LAAAALDKLGPRVHRAEQAAPEATDRADRLQAAAPPPPRPASGASRRSATDAVEARYYSLLQSPGSGTGGSIPSGR
jgi:hypothetical protein